VDLTPTVRQAARALVQVLTTQVSCEKIAPFIPAIVAQLCCGLTHINETVQLDSVKILDIYLLHYSTVLCDHTNKVLPLLIGLLSRQTSDSSKVKPNKFPSSVHSAPSSRLLKLDARLKILELVLKLVLQELFAFSKTSDVQQCRKTSGFMVDVSRRVTCCDSIGISQNDKVMVSTCCLSTGVPYIPILHGKSLISDFFMSFDDARGTGLPSRAKCSHECLLDSLNVLVGVVMENWTEASTQVFSTTSTSIPHVTFISKLIEVLTVVAKWFWNFFCVNKSSLSNVESESLTKIYSSMKAGILAYIVKHFPFSLSGRCHKEQWLLLEHNSNFMFCHTLLMLCLFKADFSGSDNDCQDFTSTVAEFLHEFKFQQLPSSSQALSVITEITVDMIPVACQLVEEGLGEEVAAKMFSFALKLYETCHPQSTSKQLLVKCLGGVFTKEVARSEFHG